MGGIENPYEYILEGQFGLTSPVLRGSCPTCFGSVLFLLAGANTNRPVWSYETETLNTLAVVSALIILTAS